MAKGVNTSAFAAGLSPWALEEAERRGWSSETRGKRWLWVRIEVSTTISFSVRSQDLTKTKMQIIV